ncbi:MAG: hypothetical protein ACYCTI_09130 [Acidimicrobiales bacterium]
MSRSVDTTELAAQLGRYGNSAFLLTAASTGGPHAVSVRVAWDGAALLTRAGRTSRANLAGQPEVTLVWPSPERAGSGPSDSSGAGSPGATNGPTDDEGFSLIVDGKAEVVPGTEDQLRIVPTAAVLHRSPARHAEDPPGSECVAVLRPSRD